MEEIIIYEKPTCSKCRLAIEILDESGVTYHKVRYHDTPLTKKKLKELIAKLGVAPKELLRTSEDLYRSLGLGKKTLQDEEVIDLLVKYPELMQRPILERGDRAVIGRPPELIREFLRGM